MYDLTIIGGGPAGMTAVVYAARKKMNTLLLTQDLGGQVLWTMDIENYMGYQFITGPELMAKFESQILNFPVDVKYEEVTGVVREPDGTFTVKTHEAGYHAKTVIISSGKRPRRLGVPGEQELTGMGVSYCATCDGPLFAGKTVAVVGSGNSALQAAVELGNVAEKVYLVARDHYIADPVVIDKVKAQHNIIELMGYESQAIQGKQAVEKYIVNKNNRSGDKLELDVQGVFVEIGLLPNSEPVTDLVRINEFGEIVVDCRTCTNIPGLFAAGDVTNGPEKQIVIAAGDGAKAALAAYDYLLHNY